VQSIGGQMLAAERAVIAINTATQLLHFANEADVVARVVLDVPEKRGNAGVGRQQDETLIE